MYMCIYIYILFICIHITYVYMLIAPTSPAGHGKFSEYQARRESVVLYPKTKHCLARGHMQIHAHKWLHTSRGN